MKRRQVTTPEIQQCIEDLIKHFNKKLKSKGNGAFVSSHEMMGALTEEWYEALKEVHRNNNKKLKVELLDIAVACIWGYVSLNQKKPS